MKNFLYIGLFLVVLLATPHLAVKAQSGAPGNSNGITMTIYPVVRLADGKQYLITPSGKQVTVPGLGIAPDATQVSVYRDQANHFWYTNLNGQPVAVTAEQLEAAQMQINAQSGGGAAPPQMMPPVQSYYSGNPTYAGGYNGIPYGTPVSMEGSGQYSYVAPGGNKQFVPPTPQLTNQWQQQVPYGQSQNLGAQSTMQSAPQSQSNSSDNRSRMDRRRDHRADRLENRSKDQASNAQSDQEFADSKMQSGETLGTGFRSRRSAREERRSNREDRRADRLQGN